MTLRLLVTGFGPFPFVRVNPTSRLARRVAGSPRLASAGIAAQALVLETSYGGGLPRLAAELAATRPDAVLMLGLAGRARAVRVERFARARSSRLHVDATGATPEMGGGGGLPLASTAALEPALACLKRAGLSAALSPSAGRYLCNAGYALALADAGRRGRNAPPTLFVHVPWLRPEAGIRRKGRAAAFRPDADRLAAALAQVALGLARQARCAKMARMRLA